MAENISGFHGEVDGLSLVDIIQLKGLNKYNGCITVAFNARSGAIYFVNGEIIHAQLDDLTGEDAIFEIIKWPGGSFSIHPEMTANVCTIHYRTDFLLMEALRRMDEENAGVSAKPAKSEPPVPRTTSSIAAKLLEIDCVTYAVLLDKDGIPLQDASIEARSLAEKGLLLARSGCQLGALTGLGEIKASVVQTKDFNLLMYDTKQHYLAISVQPDCSLDTVENEIRSAMKQGR